MASYIRIGTASLRQLPFDFAGNRARIIEAIKLAQSQQVKLLLLPELALTGYGCEDNFTFQEFNQLAEASLQQIIEATSGELLVSLGMPLMFPGGQVYNANAIFSGNGLHGFSCKQFLARNGLHYEPRWFDAWPRGKMITHPKYKVPMGDIVIDANGIRIGFETCEDSWISNRPGRDLYQRNVDIILNPSASHFAAGKNDTRQQFIREGSRAFGVVYAYANLSGTENGTSIFDGGSLIASEGKLVSFGDRLNVKEVMLNHILVNVSANRVNRINSSESIKNENSNIASIDFTIAINSENLAFDHSQDAAEINHNAANFWSALEGTDAQYTEICYAIANGLWDWMLRTHTKGYVISLSGGADSGLAASLVYLSNVVAMHQLGVETYAAKLPIEVPLPSAEEPPIQWLKIHVLPRLLWCIYQGTQNSSETTFNAAKQLAEQVGATFHHWNIDELVAQYTALVNRLYPKRPMTWETDDVTLQNIQARTRSPGVWMTANRENKLLIATSNLSESALGYATMDGDTSGVISVVSGLSKTTIRRMLVWLETQGISVANTTGSNLIKLDALTFITQQQPTAELRPEVQTDEEDLMPYEICDFIMDCYLVKQMWPKSILIELALHGYHKQYSLATLAGYIQRWFTLFCRNPWKRYGIRAGFHVEHISLDPKTFHRFPLLNSGFKEPLEQMWDYVKQKEAQ